MGATNVQRLGLSTPLVRDLVGLHFVENFVLSSTMPTPSSLGFLSGLDTSLVKSEFGTTLEATLSISAKGYSSLATPAQTLGERRALLSEYQIALHAIRQSLSSRHKDWTLAVAIYLLALFEMIVNTDSADATWQRHFNGLLAFLASDHFFLSRHATSVNIFSADTDIVIFIFRLQSRLYELTPELDSIFRSAISPRKIDVLKVRNKVKIIHKDLCTALCTSKRKTLGSIAILNNLRTASIISAKFLLESGNYLDSKNEWSLSKESRSLHMIIREALNDISGTFANPGVRNTIFGGTSSKTSSRAVAEEPRADSQSTSGKAIEGLLAMWPLHVASVAPGVTKEHEQFCRDRLLAVGELKVRIILKELEIPFDYHIVEFSETKQEPYISINPNGRLPTIEDPNTGMKIWETGAIILYLIDHYDPERKISFDKSPGMYECFQWLMFQVSGQGPYFGQLAWFARFHKPTNPSAIERYANEMERIIGVLDKSLDKKEWLVGGKCTYADLSFVTWAHVAKGLLKEIGRSNVMTSFPNYTAWLERMEARKPVRECLDDTIAARVEHGLPP
ncbi:uncharacterized protein KY384_000310 [Bacidia gigantensis]|uniref:uncharacterized protein n=1 Tax=Bacidia gigantensis TaxID=2732470 RepID=UPI001D04C6A8|nr:uncharacterized protein KY384_000310 [Bacidia gigantensis]KAG8526317.1 hypothetical protein KY384_000310 [Bacidia gigantensis]